MNKDLALAIEIAGNRAKLARKLGVGRQAIWNWEKQGFVPPARAVEIERLTDVSSLLLINPELRATILALTNRV